MRPASNNPDGELAKNKAAVATRPAEVIHPITRDMVLLWMTSFFANARVSSACGIASQMACSDSSIALTEMDV